MISTQYQTMIRNATSTAQLWFISKEFFVRKSLHNQVQIRRRLHDFKMDRGGQLMDHMMKFDELTMEMAALGDEINEQEMLVILLGKATSHMCCQKSDFQSLRNLDAPVNISIANGSSVQAVAIGTIPITLNNGEKVTIHDVLYVPELDRRLLSVPALVSRGLKITFGEHWCDIISGTKRIIRVKRRKNMYLLEGVDRKLQSTASVASLRGRTLDWDLWHARLGHVPIDRIKQLQNCSSGTHVQRPPAHDTCDEEDICAGCAKGKASVQPFPNIKTKECNTTDALEIIHSDIMGPMKPASSRLVKVYFLKAKSRVSDYFIEYKSLLERQTTRKIKCIRTDNGTEYVNKRFAEECRRNGIVHQTTAPFSPQQNGLAERMNRTLIERARAMLAHKNVNKEWWAEAVNTSAYITNRVPCRNRYNTTPIETCFGDKSDLSHLRVFGSTGFAHIDKTKRSKMDAKAYPCLFLGYANTRKRIGIHLMDGIETKYVQVIDQSPTILHKTVFIDDTGSECQLQGAMQEYQNMDIDQLGETNEHSTTPFTQPRSNSTQLAPSYIPPSTSSPMDVDDDLGREVVSLNSNHVITPWQHSETSLVPRGRVRSDESWDNIGTSIVPRRQQADDDDNRRYAKRLTIMPERANAATESPGTYEEALQHGDAVQWRKAIASELKSLNEMKTWILVDRPYGQKLIGCKWVFAIKRDGHGSIQRYKARLVAQGLRQTAGVDYNGTYSPVASISSIRVFLSLCDQLGYEVRQYDVDTAFINGYLNENVYMWPPPGIQVRPGQVCKLQRSLYGSEQASAVWYKTISKVFRKLNFKQYASYSCIFSREEQRNFVYIALYVDDMFIPAKSTQEIEGISSALEKTFTSKKLGTARFILGMELAHNINERLIKLSQEGCSKRLDEKFGQEHSAPNEDANMKNKPYRSLVDSLLYKAMSTRTDVAFAVCELSRFLEKPYLAHWNAGIRVLRYLKTTSKLGLVFNSSNGNLAIEAYSDSGWGGSRDDRRSTSGIMVMVNGTPVVYKSRLQKSVALSSAEAEYMAMSMCGANILWVKQILLEMGHPFEGPIQLFVDNQSAIAIPRNDRYQSRAKHIDIRHHFIREHVKFGNIELEYITTKLQLADFLTKAVATKHFEHLIKLSGIRNIMLRGSVGDSQHIR
uniref:Putative polyprotein n=1 Tax=Albugo laibachii Nc14 TaxID=890382 RepID=F0WK14_9STRA|nr:putative polyprotein [Albugo laibachii Nc14]|eukprot:CCA21616.1 putative polyprotein [Albugo laibachii Nc14]